MYTSNWREIPQTLGKAKKGGWPFDAPKELSDVLSGSQWKKRPSYNKFLYFYSYHRDSTYVYKKKRPIIHLDLPPSSVDEVQRWEEVLTFFIIFLGWAKQKEKKLIVGMTFSLAGRFCGDLIVTNRPQEADDVWMGMGEKEKKGKKYLLCSRRDIAENVGGGRRRDDEIK